MARPRQFDESAALETIVRQFWARGYGATSVRDLEAATGIGMTSLYNAFGGKREVFRSALEHYSERRTRECLREIERLPSPAERIRLFVTHVTEAALGDPDRMGCLVINTAIELGPHDPEIAAIVAGYLAEVETFFRRNFEAAQRAGEADQSVSAADAARAFSALMFGLRVLARTRPHRATMEGAARPLLGLLQSAEATPSSPAGRGDEIRVQKEEQNE
ncbi:TetR/AcrR family transcriptional regulator [Lutibaculum baratangense]|uniref:Transcriptional regulator, TetR family n=1 Tax=Lutibaculum baratangense AMV1 TaxID=631454 RepID=V4RGX5_9HYPH|nr:TetR/AcrR family transcriptional regulator [Lutibaculum baratangense]ESR24624.1 Transcriptional regulator, TetR family [Lutibaculum baratangense AMV1]